jgi:superfamily II DNA or RNA helicase
MLTYLPASGRYTAKITATGQDASKVIHVCGSIPGCNYYAETGSAVIPADIRLLELVAQSFPSLDISSELRAWAQGELAWERSRARITTQADAAVRHAKADLLRPYQRVGVDFASTAKKFILADDMGCVSGDAEIVVQRAGATRRMSLARLHSRFNGLSGKWEKGIPTHCRALVDGQFRQHRIAQVLDSGERDTVRVTLSSGKELVLTPDHELLCADGAWVSAGSLSVGAEILVNGRTVCPMCGTTEGIITSKQARFRGYCRTCMYRQLRAKPTWTGGRSQDSDGYIRVSGQHEHPRANLAGQVYEHVLVMEKHLGRLLDWPRENVHHVNEDRSDNRIENLKLVSSTEHHIVHRKVRNMHGAISGKGGVVMILPMAERVTSIEPAGKHRVYDIVMEDPYRNFVANGVIVHNCGKTAQAIIAVEESAEHNEVLVVCPNAVKLQWVSEIQRWSSEAPAVAVLDWAQREEMLRAYTGGWLIANYYALQRSAAFGKKRWDWLIVDEAHRLKNRATQGLAHARKIKADHVLLLTGTPMGNDPGELWALLSLVEPEKYTSYWRFFELYTDYVLDYDGGLKILGVKNEALLRKELAPRMIRRTKEEVLPQLPPKQYQTIELDLRAQAQQYKHYVDMLRRFRIERTEQPDILAINRVSQIVRLRQVLSTPANFDLPDDSCKLDAVLELLTSTDRRVIVYTVFRKTAFALCKRLDALQGAEAIPYALLVGGMALEDRDASVQAINGGRARVLVATIKAGGTGLNLQGASTVIFVEKEWNPAEQSQVENRAHRIGQTQTVHIIDLYCPGTVDDLVQSVLQRKAAMTEAVFEEALTLEYTRHAL